MEQNCWDNFGFYETVSESGFGETKERRMIEITKDMVWKSAIENYFEEFMRYFALDISQDIDFRKGYVNLDKELAQLAPKSEHNGRRCDELIRVSMKSGEEEFVLIHIEVQGYEDREFAKRMFQYMYRIYDKYDKKIYPLAIYTHDIGNNQPDRYEEKFYGMSLRYQFPIYIAIDQAEERLEQDKNPFATVVLAGLYAIKSKDKEEERFKFKRKLSKMLFQKGWERKAIVAMFYYIDNIMKLKNEGDNKRIIEEFEQQMNREDHEMKFTFDETNYAQVLRKNAMLEGMQRGKEEGIFLVAKNMLKEGIPVDLISKTTSLPKEKVLELGKLKG